MHQNSNFFQVLSIGSLKRFWGVAMSDFDFTPLSIHPNMKLENLVNQGKLVKLVNFGKLLKSVKPVKFVKLQVFFFMLAVVMVYPVLLC